MSWRSRTVSAPLLDRYADFDFKINFAFDERTGNITSADVTFSRMVLSGVGDDARTDEVDGIKISRGEEKIFIWCFFLAILQLALDGAEAYKWVEHVYIDDPISSLDEHNAIVVANHLVQLCREAQRPIKTVVSTHHALFFNVLHYELRNHLGGPLQYILKRDRRTDGYLLAKQTGRYAAVLPRRRLGRSLAGGAERPGQDVPLQHLAHNSGEDRLVPRPPSFLGVHQEGR